ncbi:hypothetical protein [Variovorax paradoxus]|uniref:Uncharacterized protein n=1 Tax=Variovorax paradoxus TaxID=34073 RepID=A0A679J623_VARPD|nr:hypothetical protein VVAX_04455 [Variovorax paradoxus]
MPKTHIRRIAIATLAFSLSAAVIAATPAAQQQQQQAVAQSAGKAVPGTPVPAGSPLAGPIHFQFAIYYAKAPTTDPMSALHSNLSKLGGSPKLLAVAPTPASATEPVVFANWNTTTVLQDYRAPNMEQLPRFGRGLSREQAEALQKADRALILDFAHPAQQSSAAMLKALQLTLQVASDTGGLVWDEETREVFTPRSGASAASIRGPAACPTCPSRPSSTPTAATTSCVRSRWACRSSACPTWW